MFFQQSNVKVFFDLLSAFLKFQEVAQGQDAQVVIVAHYLRELQNLNGTPLFF